MSPWRQILLIGGPRRPCFLVFDRVSIALLDVMTCSRDGGGRQFSCPCHSVCCARTSSSTGCHIGIGDQGIVALFTSRVVGGRDIC